MSNTDQNKTKLPTLIQTIGAGIAGGIIAWFLFIFWSIWQTPSSESFLSLLQKKLTTPSFYYEAIFLEPGFYALLFICTIGAFIGRAKWKSYKAVWIGATLPFLVWGLLGLIGGLLFPGY